MDIVECVLPHSDPDSRTDKRETPLILATIYEQVGIVCKLLQTGKVDVNACDAYGNSALLHAIQRGITTFFLLQIIDQHTSVVSSPSF